MRRLLLVCLGTLSLHCDALLGASCQSECVKDDECETGLACIALRGRNVCLPAECRTCAHGCAVSDNEADVTSSGAAFECSFAYCL